MQTRTLPTAQKRKPRHNKASHTTNLEVQNISTFFALDSVSNVSTHDNVQTKNREKMAVRQRVPVEFDEQEFIPQFGTTSKSRSKTSEEYLVEKITKPDETFKPDEPSKPEPARQPAPRQPAPNVSKSTLESYRANYMAVPKIEDRKPAFISRHLRDEIDEVIRRFGARGMSVSGFVENLVRNHLEDHRADFEKWRKL